MEKKYSLDALAEFLNYAATKGLIKKNTASSRKRAALKILAVLEDSEKQDLRNVDVEHAFERFSNLNGKEFKPASLQVFKSRLRSALTDFFAYVDNPAGFKPSGIQRSSPRIRKRLKPSGAEETTVDTVSEQVEEAEERPSQHAPHLIIPIPLRDGLTVKVHNIPADLSKLEAEKISAIVRAYAMPEA
ncbi:MAG: hypothetical protein AB2564_00380 [Candidatus Thiodiazotropha sp.]